MATPVPSLQALSHAGVSVWLDDLSRTRITSGSLNEAIETMSVVGVTTNPTIFAAALAGDGYDEAVAELAAKGVSVDEAIDVLTTQDVAEACDILLPVYQATGGEDGRVSIEVPPHLAHDTEGTVEYAKKLHAMVDRDGVMIKIPATEEGLLAITRVIAEGISVNVTLIFSLDRYRKVVEAYVNGLERAREHGHDISNIRSVASIFVSRVDTEIDNRIDELVNNGADKELLELKGKAGLANCHLAHRIASEIFDSERFTVLAAAGAHKQRPLWASTGTKNPEYSDTMYVDGLITADTVNTMPEKTMVAFAEHGEVNGDTVFGQYEEADRILDALSVAGIHYGDVMDKLEREGLEKFDTSWNELVETVTTALEKAQ